MQPSTPSPPAEAYAEESGDDSDGGCTVLDTEDDEPSAEEKSGQDPYDDFDPMEPPVKITFEGAEPSTKDATNLPTTVIAIPDDDDRAQMAAPDDHPGLHEPPVAKPTAGTADNEPGPKKAKDAKHKQKASEATGMKRVRITSVNADVLAFPGEGLEDEADAAAAADEAKREGTARKAKRAKKMIEKQLQNNAEPK